MSTLFHDFVPDFSCHVQLVNAPGMEFIVVKRIFISDVLVVNRQECLFYLFGTTGILVCEVIAFFSESGPAPGKR